MSGKVSIITPMYNSAGTISQTIESAVSQSYTDWELLLIDDCSTDNSLEIAKKYQARDSRIKVLKLDSNSGAAKARNTGIKESIGRYIAFLDSDDLWSPEKLKTQIEFMKVNQCSFSFTAYNKITESGKYLHRVGVPKKVSYKGLLKTNVVGCFTAIYDTNHFGKVLMPNIRKRQDFGLWLRLLKKTPYGYGINKSLGYYRVMSESVSSNKMNTAMYNWTLYRHVENLSFISSCYYFAHYAVKGVVRTKLPKFAKLIGWLEK